MRHLFICLASIALLAVSCQEPIPEIVLGGIAGVVSDKTTGEPVPTVNVKITETGAATVTGSDGSFTFRDLESGRYTLTLSKEGYKDNSGTVTVSDGKTIESHLLIERIPAVLTLDREVLDFGDNTSNTTLSFSMVNKNYVAIDWEIVYNCNWIAKVDPAKSLAKLAMGRTQTVVVTIDRSLLQAGENKTVIVVRTDDGSSELTVKAIGAEKKLPALNVCETTDITATSAILNAEITDNGIPEYTERGFVIGYSEMPTKQTAFKVIPAAIDGKKNFSVRVEELTIGMAYFVRAYAENGDGIAYSTNQDRFKTLATSPAVKVLPTTEIKSSSALLNGEITEEGIPEYTERGFVIGDTEMPTKETAYKVVPVAKDAQTIFSAIVRDLSLGQTYYVRAYAVNPVELVYSSMADMFSTVATLPEVVTNEATSEDEETHTAILHGSITYQGDPSYAERGFVWSSNFENPTIDDNVIKVDGSGTGDYEKRVTFPAENKTIYVRAYAKNQKGAAYGEAIKVLVPKYKVIDNLGLYVQTSDISSTRINWTDANSMCGNSSVGGLNEWRLPTKDELFQLYLLKDEIGGFVTTDDYYDSRYWSSTESSLHPYSDWWTVNFNTGSSDCIDKGYKIRARCVRTQNSSQSSSRILY